MNSGIFSVASGRDSPDDLAMRTAAARWTFLLVVLFGLGPIVSSMLLGGLRDVDGGHAASLLVGASPTSGLIRGLMMILAAGAVGVVGALVFGRDAGVLATGFMFVWGAWRVGTTEEIIRVAGGGGPLKALALEGVIVTAAGVAIGFVLQALGKKDHAEGVLLASRDEASKLVPTVGAILAAAAVAGGVAGWLVAAVPLKGQAVFAAICAGIAAGGAAQVVGTLFAARPTIVTVLISMVALAAVGPLAAQVMSGSRVLADAEAGKLFMLARPISLDWLAGAFLGIPIGLGWAASMLDRQPQPATM